jgi:site-specific DNA-methyltransferase (adenine-specific)
MPDAAREWQGWGTALKPANEPIVLARKPLAERTVAGNVLAFRTGALNIDACRVPGSWERNSTTRCDIRGGRTVGGGSGQLKCEPQAAHQLGRWPANLIHDGSDEVEAAFAAFGEKGGGGKPRLTASDEGRADEGQYRIKPTKGTVRDHGDTGTASRFFYCAKASRADRNDGLDGLPEKPLLWSAGTQNPGSFQAEGTHKAAQNNHPTVKPTELMRYLVRLVTPPGGSVFDPFTGSGSTGRGAVLEGFDFVGAELDAEYADIARRRIKAAQRVARQEDALRALAA